MLYPALDIMRCISARTFIIMLAVAVSTTAGAQASPSIANAAEPSACVAATGPDVGASPTDSAARGRDAMRRADSALHTAVYLFAAVEAQEVRFVGQPKICVRLNGDVQLDSVRVVGRRNIASPVVSGTTYRDVYVAVEILGRLNADCISARITGAAAGAASGTCASLGVRDSALVRRPPPGSPP